MEMQDMTLSLSPKERFFNLLKGLAVDRPAVINPTSVATSESCDRLGIRFSAVHLSADKMATLVAYSYENLGFDSVMPYFSVVQEAAALGCDDVASQVRQILASRIRLVSPECAIPLKVPNANLKALATASIQFAGRNGP